MNEYYNSMGRTDNFFAVIDGQQRLNSLYIGLKGSYAVKLNHKRWVDNEDNFPPMKLYLNIKNTYKQETKIDKEYEFKFLRRDKVEKENKLGEMVEFVLIENDENFGNKVAYVEARCQAGDYAAKAALDELNFGKIQKCYGTKNSPCRTLSKLQGLFLLFNLSLVIQPAYPN